MNVKKSQPQKRRKACTFLPCVQVDRFDPNGALSDFWSDGSAGEGLGEVFRLP